MCIYFIDTIIDCFLFINATIINYSRFVYLFSVCPNYKVMMTFNIVAHQMNTIPWNIVIYKEDFPPNAVLFEFFQAVTWQSLLRLSIWSCTFKLCDAVLCVRSSCLMFMYWDAYCRSHVAFLMNCFRRLSTFFIPSLFVSLSAPPLLLSKNSGTDESGCMCEKDDYERHLSLCW